MFQCIELQFYRLGKENEWFENAKQVAYKHGRGIICDRENDDEEVPFPLSWQHLSVGFGFVLRD
jgi:hypothetical protein